MTFASTSLRQISSRPISPDGTLWARQTVASQADAYRTSPVSAQIDSSATGDTVIRASGLGGFIGLARISKHGKQDIDTRGFQRPGYCRIVADIEYHAPATLLQCLGIGDEHANADRSKEADGRQIDYKLLRL